jgi:hypothetical protein
MNVTRAFAAAILGGLMPAFALAAPVALAAPLAAPVDVLFVGNSFTHGRYDPVLGYNADGVTDLTSPARGAPFTDMTGSNAFQPHPWGGVPGIFKALADQAGLDYDVSISARSAASLRGHFLNLNPADWDLRGNIALRSWDQVVLQEQSDEVLPRITNAAGETLRSNPAFTRYFADRIEDFIHSGASTGVFEYLDAFPGATPDERRAACVASGVSSGSCGRDRGPFENPNANPDAEVFLYQTWARPDLLRGAFETVRDDVDGSVARTTTPATDVFFDSLEEMTALYVDGYAEVVDRADDDGTPGFAGTAPVGEAFLRAVRSGVATRDFWSDDAFTDGLIDLWFDDGLHASTHGSYLSALTIFGTLTGQDPAQFGASETAALDLGIAARDAVILQRVASEQLGFGAVAPVPVPATVWLLGLGVGALGVVGRRRRARGRPDLR